MINDPNDTSHCYTQSRMGQVNQSLPYQLKSLLDTDLYKVLRLLEPQTAGKHI